MSLPTQITLKGRYVKNQGAVPSVTDVPETGKVTIISDVFIKNATDDDICAPHSVVAKLDDDGSFEVSVISTDDPAWLPVNRTLVIKEALSGGARTYRIAVPSASPGGVLDLADVSPVVDPTAPVTYILVSSFVAKGDILVGTGPNNFTRLPVGANATVLTADSSQASGVKWGFGGGGGGGIPPEIVNAKGDLIVGAADDVPDRLAVGSNGQVLQAASAQPLGMGWASLTKSDVGLANVDNTSDANKPVSSATQTALNGKAATVHTHAQSDVTGLTAALASTQPLDADLTTIAALAPADGSVLQRQAGAWGSRTMAQLKTDLSLTKGDVGLGNVDNTSDANKPISTATQTALDGKQPLDSDLTAIAGLSPADGSVLQRQAGAWNSRTMAQLKTDLALSKSDVGLGNVDNTSDATKFTDTPLTGKTTVNQVVVTPDTITISTGNADTNAFLGNYFKIAATANFTLTNPSNPTDGQRITWQIKQDATGNRTITLGAKFSFGADITSVTLSTAGNKIDYLGAIYSLAEDKWHVVTFMKGF